jgi:hypothetical protein
MTIQRAAAGWLLFGTVGGATALTLARVLALATVVARATATLTLAGIEPFTSVLFNCFVGSLPRDRADGGTRGSELGSRPAAVGQSGRPSYSAAQQTSEGRREGQRTFRHFHIFALLCYFLI